MYFGFRLNLKETDLSVLKNQENNSKRNKIQNLKKVDFSHKQINPGIRKSQNNEQQRIILRQIDLFFILNDIVTLTDSFCYFVIVYFIFFSPIYQIFVASRELRIELN